ncbi:MAG: DUF2924 domain-containing protein [Alphaproteobacteria bacterium]|nr:DUF2924 domain-containing protein [Alphaproteobacteria bacterium]
MDRALARLQQFSSWELREEWRRHFRAHPPKRISNDLLLRGIAHRLQEQAFGRLPAAARAQLARLAESGNEPTTAARKPRVVLKQGAQLVRDWNGETHTVEVLDRGYRWRGETHKSLSAIARKITGAHWSGPRFFGLTTRDERDR